MLGNRVHKGLQHFSNPEEKKGLKEAQYAAHVHSAASPSPLEPAGRSLPRLRAPRRGPRPRPASPPRSRPPLDGKDKRPFRSPARRTEVLNANHSSTVPGSDGVRQQLCAVAVTGVPSANSGHCSAIPDAVATLWEPSTQCRTCSALLQPLYCQLPIPPSYFPLRRNP